MACGKRQPGTTLSHSAIPSFAELMITSMPGGETDTEHRRATSGLPGMKPQHCLSRHTDMHQLRTTRWTQYGGIRHMPGQTSFILVIMLQQQVLDLFTSSLLDVASMVMRQRPQSTLASNPCVPCSTWRCFCGLLRICGIKPTRTSPSQAVLGFRTC